MAAVVQPYVAGAPSGVSFSAVATLEACAPPAPG